MTTPTTTFEKEQLFDDYEEVTARMKACLEKGDPATLDQCIRERQRLIKTIEGIKDTSPKTTGDSAARMRERLEEISRMDQDCITLVKGQLERTKKELLAVRSNRRAIVGYRSAAPSGPARFVDTKK